MSIVPEEHMTIDTFNPRPPGGQHVGVCNGVTITPIPSGITVSVASERSQHKNRAVALDAIAGAVTSPAYKGAI